MTLALLTSCVQSVYPFYEDSDVVFDKGLAGLWVGEGELKPCLLNIIADSTSEPGHYEVEFAKGAGGCSSLNPDRTKASGGARLLQVGQQRFLDVWDDKYFLHNILKIRVDSRTLALIPIDPDFLGDLIQQGTVKLQGRVQGSTMWLNNILLTSSTEDLRRFLAEHAGDKGLFSEKDALQFRRK
jgi:hypothetical protein